MKFFHILSIIIDIFRTICSTHKKILAEGLVDLSWAQDFLVFGNCVIFELFQDVCMPVMDGLQATRLIRSSEETGNWDAAVKAGIDQAVLSLDSLQNGLGSTPSAKRIPIIAVSSSNLICPQYIYGGGGKERVWVAERTRGEPPYQIQPVFVYKFSRA